MGFQTTDKHEDFRQRVREFAEKEIKSHAFDWDEHNTFPEEVVRKMGKEGFMGIPFEEKYGGQGMDALYYAITVEELSRVDGGLGVVCSAHTSLGSWPIWAFGTEEQKMKYLVPLVKGEKIGAFGLTEPNAGSDAGETETTAVIRGDYYVLNGEKIFITNGKAADTYVIFASTDPEKGIRGISAFIVEKGWEGFTFPEQYNKLGIRSSITSRLAFNNVKVPKENLLGKEGEGFKIAMATLDGGRIGIASQALGIAQGAYESALAYGRERIQFGEPIAVNQGISFKLADMATRIRASRLLIYSAAELKNQHAKYSKEAAMAKMYASDTAVWVADEALQIHGGNGYIKGMDVERFYRDAKITQIYEGTNEIMRVVIAANIVGKIGKKAGRKAEAPKKVAGTGVRKHIVFEGSPAEQVKQLVDALVNDGFKFDFKVPVDADVTTVERLVSVGQGIGEEKNMEVAKDLARSMGAAISSSRPVAENLKYLPIDRYVGMSGQKFKGNLYIAAGISGAGQHLKGIKEATTIVAINNDPNAAMIANADYSIVGDMMEIMPLLKKTIDEIAPKDRKPAPEFVKMKKVVVQEPKSNSDIHICSGCAWEYDPRLGDPENDIAPGTPFEQLPSTYQCPRCGDPKDNFIEI